MSWLDSLADNASLENQLNGLDGAPLPDKGPGFFDGALTAFDQGLTKGVLKVGDTIGQGPGYARFGSEEGLSIEDFKKRKTDARAQYAKIIQDLTPDPASVGLAGQVLNPLADVIPRAGVGAALGGPIGAALLAGVPEYTTSKTIAEAEGIDSGTASKMGLIDATVMGAGALLPAAGIFRNLWGDLGVTVGANVLLGVGQRGGTSLLLEENGYTTQAAQYQAFDTTSMLIDGVLGLGFFGIARMIGGGVRPDLPQEVLDAALVENQNNNATMSGPGVPTTPQATNAHQQSLSQALEQLVNNEPVSITTDLSQAEFLRLPRGIRNNNPGNIRADGTPWQGLVAGSDPSFATFESPEAGIRALAKNLLTYQDKHGLNTVMGIVNRWAPPGENNTQAYVNAVSKEMGVQPGDNINLRDPETLSKLTKAIIRHENGRNPYRSQTLARGVESALRNTPIENTANAVRRQLARRTDIAADVKEQVVNRFELAAAAKPDFDARLQQVLRDVGIKQDQRLPDELGSVDDIAQQFIEGNTQDPIIRASIEADSLDQVPEVMQQLQLQFPDTVNIMNFLSGDTQPTSPDGYRDMRMTVNVDGVPAEVQVTIPHMQRAQESATRLNEQAQVIERRLERQQREATPEEVQQLQDITTRRTEVYSRAWEQARQPMPETDSIPSMLDSHPVQTSDAPVETDAGFMQRIVDSLADIFTARADAGTTPQESISGFDTATRGANGVEMQAALKAIEADPNMKITLDDGREVTALEALEIARNEINQAQQDSRAYDAAVTCFLRTS